MAIGLGGLVTGITVAGAAPERLAVMRPVPDGWYVLGAHAPRAPVDGVAGAPFYAEESGDGRALTVGNVSCEDGCPSIEGTEHPLPAPLDGRLVRSGRFVWAIVANPVSPGGDDANFVAGRDVTDAQLVDAIRAATTNEYGGFVGIEATGLPAGVHQVARSRATLWGIPYGEERVTLLRGDGGAAIDVWTYVADAGERGAQRFWSQQVKLMNERPQPPAGIVRNARTSVLVEDGHRMTVVVGAPDARAAKQVARAVRPATEAQWEQFRAKIADLPAAAILPGAGGLRDRYEVDGYTAGLRWAVAGASTDAGPNEFHLGYVTADSDRVQKSSALFNGGQPMPDTALCGTLGPGFVSAAAGSPALVAFGVAPPTTTRVVLQLGGGTPVHATLGPVTADGQHRYFSGALLNDTGTPVLFGEATAYDEAGSVVAQTREFGNLTCP